MTAKPVLMVPWSTGLDWLNGSSNIAEGSLLEYARYEPDWPDRAIDWRPNDVFSGSMRLWKTERGRSAARFIWHADGDMRTYPMFMSDMLELALVRGIDKGGLVHARWTVRKRGSNFGLCLAHEED